MPAKSPKTRFSKLAILENNKMEISNMRSALDNANSKKDFSMCIQNMAAYFYEDDHDNFWTAHKDLKMQLVFALNQSAQKSHLLFLLDKALSQVDADIQSITN